MLALTALARAGGKEQRTAKALGTVAVGVLELVGGMHAQACRAIGGPVGVTWDGFMAVAVEGDGGDTWPMGHRFVDIPVIEGSICDLRQFMAKLVKQIVAALLVQKPI